MKIKVPEYVLKYNLTDHELVFCSFMGWAGRRGAKKVRWYMYSDDIKHILGHVKEHKSFNKLSASEYNAATSPEAMEKLKNIKQVFNIGMLGFHTYTVDFNAPEDAWNKNGSIRYTEVEINSLDAIKIYYYLVGRISSNEELIQDGTKIENEHARKTTVLAKFFDEHFMI